MILELSSDHVKLLKKETERVQPIEAVGMLFGEINNKKVIVEKIEFAHNRLNSQRRFEVDPEIVAKTIIESEKDGLEFIGLFHSHPGPSIPSLIDRKYMRLWGDAIWLIKSITGEELSAYYLIKNKVKEVDITIK